MGLSIFLDGVADNGAPTPDIVRQAIEFKAETKLENWEFMQYHRLRQDLVAALKDPWSVRAIDDVSGYGVKVHISDRQEPTSRVWDALNDYVLSIGWVMFTHAGTGYSRDVTLDKSTYFYYEVKLYSHRKIINYDPKHCIYYVGWRMAEFLREHQIDTMHDAQYGRYIISSEDMVKLRELGYVAQEV
jgi:hypothetical protein